MNHSPTEYLVAIAFCCGPMLACADRGSKSGEDAGDGTSDRDGDGEERGDDDGDGWDDDGRPKPECGNEQKELGEQCDGEDLGDLTCRDIGYYAGELDCKACKFDEDDCTEPPPDDQPECGNGEKEPGEICDGDDLGGLTCEDFGSVDGEGGLQCAAGCKLDFDGCRRGEDGKGENCGNGQLDPGETCDGGVNGVTCEDLGFEGGELHCDANYCFLDTRKCE